MGAACTVEMRGWNLPNADLALNLKDAKPGLLPLVATRGQSVSNFVPFAVDALPELLEKEPNNTTPAAQPLTLPVIVNGRIDPPGDTDVFRIEGKAGSEIVAEIFARRLNSPLDSVLKLTDASGKKLAFNDDNEDKGAGLTTHHADSRITAKLPADGAYFIHLADTQHGGSSDHAYRLRVRPPQPDFELRVVPSNISGRTGTKTPITVHALRRDRFAGEIALALKDPPAGFKISGGSLPADKDLATFTITLPEALEEPVALDFEGRAKISEREVSHRTVPADDVQQAFAYRHLVLAKVFRAWVTGRFGASGAVRILSATPMKIPAGGTARVQIAAPVGDSAAQTTFELTDPPAGIRMKAISIKPDRAEIEFTAEAEHVVAGERGTVTLQAFATLEGKRAKSRRISLGALAAIAYQVFGK